MSYPYEDTTLSSDPFDMPLGTYESLAFEDFERYFESQLCQTGISQTGNPYSSPKRPQQPQPIASTSSSIPTWDSTGNGSSSSIYPVSRGSSFPEFSWTSNASYSDLHPIPSSNVISDTFNNFNLSVENNDTFLASIDPSLISPSLFTVTANPSIPHAPNPVGHLSPPSRKRLYEGPDFSHASSNLNPKRRRLSTDGPIDLSTIPPPPHFYNNNNNEIPDIVNNSYLAASGSQTDVMLSQPKHSMFRRSDVPHPFVNISPAPAATIPPAYAPVTQPGSNVSSQTINYPAGSNVYPYPDAKLYTASGDRNGFPWDPLSYSPLPQADNGTLDWMADLLGSENFLNTTNAFGVTPGPSVPTLVPPFLEQQAPMEAPYNDAIHTNAYANNAMHSGVDNRQHSTTTIQMSKIGHTANASMPRTGMPSTRGASSAELVSTLKFNQPTPSPPSPPTPPPKPTKAHRKQCKQLVPAEHLWTLKETPEGIKPKCLYNGPAMPGGCNEIQSTIKNLGRHMRTHACAEDKMSIPEAEKVALNGLPDGLRVQVATCFLRDADLHRCAYFREHGKRWEEVTLERLDNASRKHDVHNHPLGYRKKMQTRKAKPPKKRKAKA